MFEIILFGIGIILIILLIPYLAWRLIFGGSLRYAILAFFNTAHKRDQNVDPEAEILPSTRQPISDVMHQQAEIVKQAQGLPASNQSAIPKASMQATTSEKKTRYEPPYRENPVTIEAQNQTILQPDNSIIEVPVQPLVEDQSFKVEDPIIDKRYIDPNTPSADTLDAHVPKSDSSPYGVRSADHSPGRRLRDKRYRRNASS